MSQKRHLHRDYGTAYCDIDIGHVLATYAEAECDCAKCLKGLAAHHEELRRAAEEAEAAAAATGPDPH